ncbi:MAG: hypothetical protein ACO225_03390 [Ilumatobacteraceae bacterium]
MDVHAETIGPPGSRSVDHVRRGAFDLVEPAATFGIGPLPHRSARDAAVFSFDAFDVPAIPSLPRRSPAESSIAQALSGVPGVSGVHHGTVEVDRLDPGAPVETDVHSESFVGFRAFLDEARRRQYTGPVKWQFAGPVSVGIALVRAGAPPSVAFEVAASAVSGHLRALADEVTGALPGVQQLVVLDEPLIAGFFGNDFPIDPDGAIDIVSTAMASIEDRVTTGLHTCSATAACALVEAGPQLLSLPVSESVLDSVGRLETFLQRGGRIAWGAVATEGPIGVTSTRSWHRLSMIWCDLVNRGCDAERLRQQSLLTPQCGLAGHSNAVAERVCLILRDVSRSVRSSAAAARLLLGG